jgi:hypothetical protein
VPYVRINLLIATRWKPLPPRHFCGNQAYHYTFAAPIPRGSLLRGVMLSTSIIAHTTPSASLIRILPISDFNPYTEGLWHSRIDPAYLPDLPQFTLRFLLYMPSSSLRQAVSLHSSVSSRNVLVFAHNVKARHLLHCPRHFRLISQRTGDFPKLQCSLYATACKFARPTEVASYTFVRIWVLLLPSFPVIGHPHTSRI